MKFRIPPLFKFLADRKLKPSVEYHALGGEKYNLSSPIQAMMFICKHVAIHGLEDAEKNLRIANLVMSKGHKPFSMMTDPDKDRKGPITELAYMLDIMVYPEKVEDVLGKKQ